jgi:hypothetical protein
MRPNRRLIIFTGIKLNDLGFAMGELFEHVVRNRAYWDDLAGQYVDAGERRSDSSITQ